MSYDLIVSLAKKVMSGLSITIDEAMELTTVKEDSIPILLAFANKIRQTMAGDCFDTCEIINARSGNCTEDCKFCAQSAHYQTAIEIYPLLEEEKILQAAKTAESDGAHRFSIVTAGCGLDGDPDFTKILNAVRLLGRETNLSLCCSLGIVNSSHLEALKEAGITRYHHNLETSKSFYSNICTTHSYQARIDTIKKIKAAGMQVCSGGIIGMGETWSQRIEMAFTLKDLDVDSIPLNILSPIEGTALAGQKRLRPLEILQTFAIFRFILPTKTIRSAGGREYGLGDLIPLSFLSGMNGVLLGNYLTTTGRSPADDLDTLSRLGLQAISAKADS